MARALVTRPAVDARPLADALERRGFAVVIEPLIEIVPVEGAVLALEDIQGALATSANGVRALGANTPRRDLAVWAVGEATAAEARRLGFVQVETAGGDVDALAARVIAGAQPEAGAFLHVAGSHVAGDLAGQLGAHGFEVRRAVLYEARAAKALSAELRRRLARRQIDVAFFFSPRTATSFVTLARAAGVDEACAAIAAYALSPAVAQALDPLAWRTMGVGAERTQEALLALLDTSPHGAST
jgi:uroporphyrinogen-III synthase